MKNWTKVLLGIALSFGFLFICIGYASLSDTLTISGVVNAAPPEGIYLIDAQTERLSNATLGEARVIDFTTSLDSTVNIQAVSSGWWQTSYGSVTYKLTVLNNTAYRYAYSGIDYISSLDGYNGNPYIGSAFTVTVTDENGGSFVGDIIEPGEQAVFYATYAIKRQDLADIDLKTLVKYKFGVNVDSVGDVALDAALIRFGEILNDTSEGGAYETLTDKIDDKYDGTAWKANYIGNVVDAHNDDTETINSLFEGKLSLTIDGVATNVTVLIKRENLDGNTQTGDDYVAEYYGYSTSGSGCEMTLYMTTDPLQSGNPVVYAAVFTCDRNEDGSYSDWYMIGDKYIGTASIVGYEGSYVSGSFDTGTWRSTGSTTYTACESYRYTVPSGRSISTIIQATDAAAVDALQTRITQANDLLNGVYGQYAGSAMIHLQTAFDIVVRHCTVNSDGTVTVNSSISRAHAVPFIKKLEQALVPFEGIITS